MPPAESRLVRLKRLGPITLVRLSAEEVGDFNAANKSTLPYQGIWFEFNECGHMIYSSLDPATTDRKALEELGRDAWESAKP